MPKRRSDADDVFTPEVTARRRDPASAQHPAEAAQRDRREERPETTDAAQITTD
jgi:hypothetical protein